MQILGQRPGVRRWPRALVLGLIVGLGLVVPGATGQAAGPVAAEELPATGTIYTTGLDNSGNGWAWGAAANDLDTPHLLRRAAGAWTDVSAAQPNVVARTAALYRIVVTDAGDAGWAIGQEKSEKPVLWRIKGSAWTQTDLGLTSTAYLSDLTLSGDGTDGFLLGSNNDNQLFYRLINGTWTRFAAPARATLQRVAISPNGDAVWAAGATAAGDTAVWYLDNFTWTRPSDAIATVDSLNSLTVSDDQRGWLLLPPGGERRNSTLYRLTISGTVPINYDLPLVAGGADAKVELNDVVVDAQGRGWASGTAITTADPIRGSLYTPILLRVSGDTLTQVPVTGFQATQEPTAYAILYPLALSHNGAYGWVSGFDSENIRFLNWVPLVEPWTRPSPPAAGPVPGSAPGRCFAAVPYCLRGVFAAYWAAHGGLAGLGYPITPEVLEAQGTMTYTVQYTQRARLEYHPEFAGTANEVLLGLLGNALADPRAAEAPFAPTVAQANPAARFFPETQHNVGAPFLEYWTKTGGLAIYGLPRSEAFTETNAANGQPYPVQYFERNRIEYHAENAGTPFEYLLGLLGVEQFAKTYGYIP